ncbi:MAG TPA: UvrD-helicase domain-containing protein [Gemmatimonadaceae bacterium]|nr:UvrD-helicase domain-containing protein [Gemmatimonadaceae bacterium]
MEILTDDALLSGLNPAQREAVIHTEGPLLVLAGAGSGKTRVLTTRIARLVAHHGVDPARLLAVTFTNKAAGEMRDRIERILGEPLKGMWVGTFHAIGARMLRMHPERVGRTNAFTIYDEDDALAIVKRIMERHNISAKQFTPKGVFGLVSDAKNALVPPGEYESLAMDPFARAAAVVYRELEGELRRANAVTFDDLLVLPVQMLREHADLRERYQERFQFILVDEYQDTNRAQYHFIKLLGALHRNVCVVGDDDQSIYGWRGADIRNILDFNKDFADAAVVRLEENYRSTPAILDLANLVISANTSRMGKTLRPTITGGEPVSSVRALDERDEADWVVEEIVARRAASGSLQLRDFAVLYRTNAQSRAMEESLRRKALPYRLIGAVRFYDRREIRDLMSYLKLIANPADDEAFRRAVAVPKRGIGDASVELLAERARAEGLSLLAAATRSDLVAGIRPATRTALADFAALIERLRTRATDAAVDELLRELVDAIRYGDYLRAEGEETALDRLENVRELITSAAETVADEGGEVGLTPLDHFLQRAMLVAAVDGLDPNADAVTLMTLHNAKGLEFPFVFVTGLEDGLFPLAKAFDDPPLLEEERRLFYVGITRAERKLYLTHAEQRRRNGEMLAGKPSSFLTAIPEDLLDKRNTVKVRSSGRAFMSGYSGYAGSRSTGSGIGADRRGSREERGWTTRTDAFDDADLFPPSPAARRPGRPLGGPPMPAPGEESQDAAIIAVGARVKHRKFGSGTIAEIAGSGRDAKVRVDFDDEEVGRKTLVVAQANLERGDE